jgi:hypothetical protein
VFTADRVTGGITKLTDAFTTLFSQQNLSRASGVFEGAFGALKTVDFGAIAGGLKITADATKGVVNAFLALPPDLQKIAVAALAANKLTGGLVTSGIADVVKGIAGLALGGLKTITAGSVTVVGASVAGSGVPGVPSPGGPGSTLGKLASVVQNVAIRRHHGRGCRLVEPSRQSGRRRHSRHRLRQRHGASSGRDSRSIRARWSGRSGPSAQHGCRRTSHRLRSERRSGSSPGGQARWRDEWVVCR